MYEIQNKINSVSKYVLDVLYGNPEKLTKGFLLHKSKSTGIIKIINIGKIKYCVVCTTQKNFISIPKITNYDFF